MTALVFLRTALVGDLLAVSRGLALILLLSSPWKVPTSVSLGSATTDSCEKARMSGVREVQLGQTVWSPGTRPP